MKSKKSIFNIDSLIIVASLLSMVFINLLIGNLILIGFVIFKLIQHKDFLIALKGSKFYKKGDYEKAIAYYKKASTCKNAKSNVIRSYIFLEIKHGSVEEAEKTLDFVHSNNKLTEKDIFDLKITDALIKWKKRDLSQSINILEELLKDSESSTLYETLGYLLLANKEYDKALDLNLKASKYNETLVVKANLAETYYKLSEINKSKDLFASIIQSNAKFSEPYYYYGLILKEEGQTIESKKFLEKALSFPESFLSVLTKEKIQNELNSLDLVEVCI